MRPVVRNLYKRILLVGREYPLGLPWVKKKAKAWFLQNQELTETVDINRAVATGRYMVKEMIGVIQLKKYRAMKQRYYDDDAETLAAHKQAEAIADELRRGKKA